MKQYDDSRSSVLVVDDEPNIALAVRYLLEKEGMHVMVAHDSEQALQHLEGFVPDIVVLDVMMPGMSGYALARHLHVHQLCPDARIVFLTAKGAEQDRAEGYAVGGEYYITKPFDNQAFIETIKEIVAYEL